MRQLLTTGTRGNPTVQTLEVDGIANMSQVVESVSVNGTSIPATTTITVSDGSLHYYSANAAANWTVDITDTVDLNTTLSTGHAMTVVTLVTQGGTAYYNTAITVDGSAPTVVWLSGSSPIAGTADGIDVYSYTVVKTADATFTVFASVTNFG